MLALTLLLVLPAPEKPALVAEHMGSGNRSSHVRQESVRINRTFLDHSLDEP